jgi:hypothetical protein
MKNHFDGIGGGGSRGNAGTGGPRPGFMGYDGKVAITHFDP